MWLTHIMYIVFFRVSWKMMLVDVALASLCYKAFMDLEKKKVLLYMASLIIIFFVGLTHFPNKASFRSGYHQVLFLIQIVYYAISTVLIGERLKAHAAMQEVIRCFNYNQYVRGRVKLKVRATL